MNIWILICISDEALVAAVGRSRHTEPSSLMHTRFHDGDSRNAANACKPASENVCTVCLNGPAHVSVLRSDGIRDQAMILIMGSSGILDLARTFAVDPERS